MHEQMPKNCLAKNAEEGEERRGKIILVSCSYILK